MVKTIILSAIFILNVLTKNLSYCKIIFSNHQFQVDDSLSILIKNIKSNSNVYLHYEKLNLFYSKNYSNLTIKQRGEVRDVLNKFGSWSSIQICDLNEPGRHIKLAGRITDENNIPVPMAKITIYEADASGFYAPQDATTHHMSEHDPRLYGSILTGKDGHYTMVTIHPGTYPILYEGRHIPQHIHFNIVVKGFQSQNLQIVFDDDPAMKDKHWQDWARELKYPIVQLNSSGNISIAVLNVKLKKA